MGHSCFPLSPCEDYLKLKDKSQNLVSQNDQLVKILRLTEPVTDETISFTTKPETQDYVNSLSKSVKRIKLSQYFDKTSKKLLGILKSLLELNPYLRTTANELLKNSLFDMIRVPEIEIAAESKVDQPWDQSNTYSYSQDKDLYFKDMGKIKSTIFKEIKKLKKQNKDVYDNHALQK